MSNITDGMYAYIAGTVSDATHRGTSQGFRITVDVQRPKAQYPDQVTVWYQGTGSFSKGDRVKFKGWLSWMRNEAANGKTYFNVSLNKPELLEQEKSYQQQMTAEQVAEDILGAKLIDDEAPF